MLSHIVTLPKSPFLTTACVTRLGHLHDIILTAGLRTNWKIGGILVASAPRMKRILSFLTGIWPFQSIEGAILSRLVR